MTKTLQLIRHKRKNGVRIADLFVLQEKDSGKFIRIFAEDLHRIRKILSETHPNAKIEELDNEKI